MDQTGKGTSARQPPEPVRATPHATSTYTPAPAEERHGLALCLSGGGYRAALFHLGALRRLNELGILPRVDTITAVSGGSIIAAFLAKAIADLPSLDKGIPDWEERIARPLRALTARNIRTGPILDRFVPGEWFNPSASVEALAAEYETVLSDFRLSQLPPRPNFVICATDMVFGSHWVCERTRVGNDVAGYVRPPPDWPVARAVAASSCFPPIFDPLIVGLEPKRFSGGEADRLADRDTLLGKLHLTDGGVYDNLGLEPVWKSHATILVSDGGAPFAFATNEGILGNLSRYVAIKGNQVSAIRKRWLISNFLMGALTGAYWGIDSAVSSYDLPTAAGYSRPLVQQVVAKVRTDLDAFSPAEMAVLENHGYLLADAAIAQHVPSLVGPTPAPAVVPHPDWLDEAKVQQALADSHRRSLFGRR